MREKIKKVILKRTITLVERVAFKSSKDPSRWGFYETPIPEKLKNRTKHNS
ncbi:MULTISPECIES: cyclic lactone autoinducer peptide [Dorea]|uniref:Cyclic lactone autoinducer peptide n=1 Tax=Dorea formicigenerans TaxID=39486 RepID=A0A413QNC5_9FIRM|nr:cyclic lactone autoinducer peptide [Dorea sp. 210702-DFI.3.125]RHA01769.1 cyclic lactone autoinducer peptide [Dorea formicigenerans]